MTGAGRAAKEEMLFSEVSEGFHAYGVGHHRHMAELDQEFSLAAGREVVVKLHAASGADESRHPVDDLCARAEGRRRRICMRYWQSRTRKSRSSTCCRSARCRRRATCAAPT